MSDKISILSQKEIENRIFTIRGFQVMIDSHLAEMYGVEIKRLNEQVKRNIDRFPDSFRFHLTEKEWEFLRYQIGTLKDDSLRSQIATIETGNDIRSQNATLTNRGKHRKYLPYAFTEQGENGVTATIFTRQMSNQLLLYIKKYNEQYPAIEIKTIADTHDRFLLLDLKELYHIGASFKDLGKKWFAFSRMDDFSKEILNRIRNVID